jgi:hypothetical protein
MERDHPGSTGVTAQPSSSRGLAIAVILTAVFVTSLDFFVVNVVSPRSPVTWAEPTLDSSPGF